MGRVMFVFGVERVSESMDNDSPASAWQSEDSGQWKANTPRGLVQRGLWGTLWESRELMGYFALRDLRLRYRQAALGVVWVLFQPVATVAIFTLVFNRLAGIDSQGVPYPLFALVGMVTWTYFASSVQAASTSLVSNASLVTKVYFPRGAAPGAALLPPAVDLGISMALVFAMLCYYQVYSGIRLIGVLLWLLLLGVTALGVALWLSALNVRFRDVQHAVAPLLQLWLFASPVAYPATLLEGWQAYVYSINPMVGVIGVGRWCLLGAPWPGWSLAVSAGTATLACIAGLAYFSRAQRSFADVI